MTQSFASLSRLIWQNDEGTGEVTMKRNVPHQLVHLTLASQSSLTRTHSSILTGHRLYLIRASHRLRICILSWFCSYMSVSRSWAPPHCEDFELLNLTADWSALQVVAGSKEVHNHWKLILSVSRRKRARHHWWIHGMRGSCPQPMLDPVQTISYCGKAQITIHTSKFQLTIVYAAGIYKSISVNVETEPGQPICPFCVW